MDYFGERFIKSWNLIIYWYEYWAKRKRKNWFSKRLPKTDEYSVFEKTMKNIRKHKYLKLITIEKGKSYLVFEPYCHTAQPLSKKSIRKWNKERQIFINNAFYSGLSVLEISRTAMFELWYH